ncbi:PPC domain-containing DNA-binding protein [Actinophytocola sp.]|uniref:PPC domain-containing DNA-binding protein n=1 Tax=Actinophytocola sp. TaxID=1872138 RepID=UPI003899D3CD
MVGFAQLDAGPPRSFVVALDAEDSVTDSLVRFAAKNRVEAAAVTAFGGFGSTTLGFFDLETREYVRNAVDEQTELLSLVGDIGRDDGGELALHAHVVLGLRDGTTRGGHLLAATVRPTLEVMVTESLTQLRRRYRKDLGLTLLDLPNES